MRKKITTVILAAAMAMMLMGCGSKENDTTAAPTQTTTEAATKAATEAGTEAATKAATEAGTEAKTEETGGETDEPVVGGWSKPDSPAVTKEIQDYMKKANEVLAGATFEPVAVIGTQVVAGMNYRLLCKETATVPDAKTVYSIVTLYADPQGEVSLSDIVTSSIQAPSSEELDGGISETASPEIPAEAKAAFDKATETLVGATYTPLALSGTQVVAGTNYILFCEKTLSDAEGTKGYAVMTVYAGVDGTYSVVDINDFTQDEMQPETEPASEQDTEGEATTEGEGNPDGAMVGGWSGEESTEVSAEIQEYLKKAAADQQDVTLTPIAVLGTQVVAGKNYRLLCAATKSGQEGSPVYAVVTMYVDLQKNATISDMQTSDVPAISANDEQLAGGVEAVADLKITTEAEKAFKEAVNSMDYIPVALLGTQVVAGTNYMILCESKSDKENTIGKYTILTVYAPLEGECEVINSQDIATF